jgi:hypothetical protein
MGRFDVQGHYARFQIAEAPRYGREDRMKKLTGGRLWWPFLT